MPHETNILYELYALEYISPRTYAQPLWLASVMVTAVECLRLLPKFMLWRIHRADRVQRYVSPEVGLGIVLSPRVQGSTALTGFLLC